MEGLQEIPRPRMPLSTCVRPSVSSVGRRWPVPDHRETAPRSVGLGRPVPFSQPRAEPRAERLPDARTRNVAIFWLLWLLVGHPIAALSQPLPNQYGGQDRADAASRMIVIAVQQGISSLPPTSGQSFVYDYDPAIDSYVTSPRLGPISFRSPLTIGEGRLSVRLAGSYFHIGKSFEPVTYAVTDRRDGSAVGFTALGLHVDADVGLVNVGGTYGLTDWADLTLNIPITVVDAHAEQVYPVLREQAELPPDQAGVVFGPTLGLFRDYLRTGTAVFRSESFETSGKEFNSGTSAGVGRISFGGKFLFLTTGGLRAAFSTEFFFPSPNQKEFAGSDSAAILPRLIGMYELSEAVRFHLDTGYDYDFEVAELSRFVWNVGVSIAPPGITFDFGLGGSEFQQAVRWTPRTAAASAVPGFPGGFDLTAIGNIDLGTTFVDFLGGLKIKLADNAVLGGSVNVPLTSDGLRADAVGTVAAEVYF